MNRLGSSAVRSCLSAALLLALLPGVSWANDDRDDPDIEATTIRRRR